MKPDVIYLTRQVNNDTTNSKSKHCENRLQRIGVCFIETSHWNILLTLTQINKRA